MSFTPNLDDRFEVLASAKREIGMGMIVAGAFFIGLLGLAALTPMDLDALAPGIVAVLGNRQAVQHLDGVVTA
jgi:hypothetical protein